MQHKIANYKIKGMSQDTSKSTYNPELSYENKNIRITTKDNNSLLSIQNEQGTKSLTLKDVNSNNVTISGVCIGVVETIDGGVVFVKNTTTNTDYIYHIINIDDTNAIATIDTLFSGDLNLAIDAPIYGLFSYENEDIQKIYWVDKNNSPRVINIKGDKTKFTSSNYFNFVNDLQLKETVSIVKNDSGSGVFPVGTIQYAFTYYNKFAQESNIFYISPIMYISHKNRGGAPNDTISNSFIATISNLDSNFDYLRVYSIIRTSIDTTPIVRRVTDVNIDSLTSVIINDNNTTGEIVDSTQLLYVGGEEILAKTIAVKDTTLFLGNLTLKRNLLSSFTLNNFTVAFTTKQLYSEASNRVVYGYNPVSLNDSTSWSTKSFKYGDVYRFGIQAQHKTGRWSDVMFLADTENTVKPGTYFISDPREGDKVLVVGSQAIITITDTSFLQNLAANGFVKIRGVVVYPELQDRNVIAQGLINPTLIHVNDKINKVVDNISSWFFRPIRTSNTTPYAPFDFGSTFAEYRHHYAIPGFKQAYIEKTGVFSPIQTNCEIQCNSGYPERIKGSSSLYQSNFENNFYIDQSVLSFNSPEFEFDPSLLGLEGEQFKMRIIGISNITAYNTSININAGSPYDTKGGNKITPFGISNYSSAAKQVSNYPLYYDRVVKESDNNTNKTMMYYAIYPWHANRSLNNDVQGTSRSAVLNNKQTSYLRYSGYNTYFNNWEPSQGITTLGIYNADNDNITKISSPYQDNSKFTYKGSLDKLVGPNTETIKNEYGGYPIVVRYNDTASIGDGLYSLSNRMGDFGGNLTMDYKIGTELTRIKFKSTTHAVFGLNWNQNEQIVLPVLNADTFYSQTSNTIFYRDGTDLYSFTPYNLNLNLPSDGGLYIAELYRDPTTITNRFGGNSDEAYQNNNWLPCSAAVRILDSNNAALTTVTLQCSEGDTFIQRYDCLKTFSEDLTQPNSIVDIASTLLETHINLDGRYDKNRGKLNNTTTNASNFNLINSVYNQKNNYFTYHKLDSDRFSINYFPNTFTWTGSKTAGALVDSWTNITMLSTYDVNGSFGPINSIQLFNDQLLGFQNSALFNILFNSRIQINTSDGTPIQLANSGKVDSVKYFSTTMGAKNQMSILPTINGVYFIDDNTKSINLFNGQINTISDNLGFRSWMQNHHSFSENFDLTNNTNFTITYDKINKDVYFINNQYALSYSELLNTFTSFYNYENTPFMFNINDAFYAMSKDRSIENTDELLLWKLHGGDFNKFFNVTKGFYVNYLVNPDPTIDKVFDSFQSRMDAFDSNNHLLAGTPPITRVIANTEYQTANALVDTNNFREKFRVWRGLIPRATSLEDSLFLDNPNKLINMDRVRNPWAFITLQKDDNIDNNKVVIQDTSFKFTE